MTCEYFTRYGNSGVPGACNSRATLTLVNERHVPPIRVCFVHARTIVARFPTLGDVAQRFRKEE